MGLPWSGTPSQPSPDAESPRKSRPPPGLGRPPPTPGLRETAGTPTSSDPARGPEARALSETRQRTRWNEAEAAQEAGGPGEGRECLSQAPGDHQSRPWGDRGSPCASRAKGSRGPGGPQPGLRDCYCLPVFGTCTGETSTPSYGWETEAQRGRGARSKPHSCLLQPSPKLHSRRLPARPW